MLCELTRWYRGRGRERKRVICENLRGGILSNTTERTSHKNNREARVGAALGLGGKNQLLRFGDVPCILSQGGIVSGGNATGKKKKDGKKSTCGGAAREGGKDRER